MTRGDKNEQRDKAAQNIRDAGEGNTGVEAGK
jgi:hypothetical protein